MPHSVNACLLLLCFCGFPMVHGTRIKIDLNEIPTECQSNVTKTSDPLRKKNGATTETQLRTELEMQIASQTFRPTIINLKFQPTYVGIMGGTYHTVQSSYFVAISAIKCGAERSYLFCTQDATTVIQTYSSELIVLPFLDQDDGRTSTISRLSGTHSIIIGPSLGHDFYTSSIAASVIHHIKENSTLYGKLNVIFDGDGIMFLAQHEYLTREFVGNLYITCNTSEVEKLATVYLGNTAGFRTGNDAALQELVRKINRKAILILKGKLDKIVTAEGVYVCSTAEEVTAVSNVWGEILAGVLGVFARWADLYSEKYTSEQLDQQISGKLLASYATCYVSRLSAKYAYEAVGRDMVVWDAVKMISRACENFFKS